MLGVARARESRGEREQAATLYRQVLERAPGSKSARAGLARLSS